MDELKRGLTEAWLGIQQSVIGQEIVRLNICVKAYESILNTCWDVSIIFYETYVAFFVSQVSTSHDF